MEAKYDKPFEIAEGIYWVGFAELSDNLNCNPYLIIDGDEAVLIDGGSRPDFSTVMMKILQTGVDLSMISHLIYHHYDPDLCGSIPNLEAIINNDDLKIISHMHNNLFINYYNTKSPTLCISRIDMKYTFRSGRVLKFYRTPYAHSPGSFITYDTKTKTLFTSDLYGGAGGDWDLYLKPNTGCLSCRSFGECKNRKCPFEGLKVFHQIIMPSNLAMSNALDVIESIDADRIAPQHGSIIEGKEHIQLMTRKLRLVNDFGIDRWIKKRNS